MFKDTYVYLDTYVLQQDMRIRLPKSILSNTKAVKGETKFDVYLDSEDNSIVLRVHESKGEKING